MKPAAAANLRSLYVMLVDDDAFTLELVSEALRNIGVTHIAAFAGAPDALAYLAPRVDRIDAILLDLDMPEMDGVEFLRKLAAMRFAGGIAILSGAEQRLMAAVEQLAGAHQLKPLGKVPKPVTREALRQVLDRCDGRPVRRAQRGAEPAAAADEIYRCLRHDDLLLFYQPKVRIGGGAVDGVEALVRWSHPERGLLGAERIVSACETHGLMNELTEAVIGKALRQQAAWRNQGLRLKMSINVSMDNLDRLDFTEQVTAALTAHGVAAEDVILEVTESLLLRDLPSALDILSRLRLRGIGLSIDDFGTGHASLEKLKMLPFTELKIDRGFVHGAAADAAARAILESSATLARRFGMASVAEGVEDEDDWHQVAAAGIDMVQGYHIAKPMAAPAFQAWLRGYRAGVAPRAAARVMANAHDLTRGGGC